MNLRSLLLAILGISIFGALFSGVLTYQELFLSTAASCPAPGAPGTVFGYPACVYGFFLYLILSLMSGLALKKTHRGS
ncbi:hypothetical protein IT407_02235 [Candidatus Uhrbacteria bacterium]|nr:hypothetical protein [Candidatus Uhrbacteria bacterium]